MYAKIVFWTDDGRSNVLINIYANFVGGEKKNLRKSFFFVIKLNLHKIINFINVGGFEIMRKWWINQ